MKTNKSHGKWIGSIIAVIFIFSGIVLLFAFLMSKITTEGKQDYFEGKVLENTNDSIIVQIDSSYEDLVHALGETVEIEKADIVKECDFSKLSSNESVRVLYSGIHSKSKRIEHVFAVYLSSELP